MRSVLVRSEHTVVTVIAVSARRLAQLEQWEQSGKVKHTHTHSAVAALLRATNQSTCNTHSPQRRTAQRAPVWCDRVCRAEVIHLYHGVIPDRPPAGKLSPDMFKEHATALSCNTQAYRAL